ncbi:protein kinase [Legionella steelei]|uniref:protein kinase n=1 Tax=Legionella steelei TaxID=947033 RepID=UPI001872A8D5|nr:protein kinase [Legionella steelei]
MAIEKGELKVIKILSTLLIPSEQAQKQLQETTTKPMKHAHFIAEEKKIRSITLATSGIEKSNVDQAIERLSSLNHDSILRFEGCVPRNKKGKTIFNMEFFSNQNLYDIAGELSEERILEISLQLISGLMYYESKGLYPSFRLDSIMVCDMGKVKFLDELINLDERRKIHNANDGSFTQEELLSDALGILSYPKEKFERGFKANSSSVAGSFGILLLEMFKGEKFANLDYAKIRALTQSSMQNNHPIPPTCPKYLADIIKDCLKNPGERPTLSQLKDRLVQAQAELTMQKMQNIRQEKNNLLAAIPTDILNSELRKALTSYGVFANSDGSNQKQVVGNNKNYNGFRA